MSEYRKIHYPKCPHCGLVVKPELFDYDYGKLVGMATGHDSDNVIIKCKHCGLKYRVTCSITYHARKLKE